MNEFVSWCRHLLVSFLFHALTSLHPPSFYRNDFFHLFHSFFQSKMRFAPRARIELRARALGRVPAAHAQITSPSCDTEQMALCSPFLLGAP